MKKTIIPLLLLFAAFSCTSNDSQQATTNILSQSDKDMTFTTDSFSIEKVGLGGDFSATVQMPTGGNPSFSWHPAPPRPTYPMERYSTQVSNPSTFTTRRTPTPRASPSPKWKEHWHTHPMVPSWAVHPCVPPSLSVCGFTMPSSTKTITPSKNGC